MNLRERYFEFNHHKFVKRTKVGDVVCDCRYQHHRIVKIEEGTITLDDGYKCDLFHCCDSPNHKWQHPTLSEETN